MKLKELVEKYGEYEVYETKGDWCDAGHITLELNKPIPKTVWDLKKGDVHYWVGYEGYVEGGNSIWIDSDGDKNAREVGNVFLTKEEAVQDVERRKVETLLLKHGGRRWYKDNEDNFVIRYATEEKMLWVDSVGLPVQGTIYFDSIGDAMNAMRENGEIGAERIIKALFEVR